MDVPSFLGRGRPRWERLTALLDRMDASGLKSLSLEEAREFGRLYRAASSDLLWARSHAANAELVDFLNALVARGYARTYPGRTPQIAEVWAFYAAGFPVLLRRHGRAFAAAVSLFVGGAAIGYAGMHLDPKAATTLLPEQHLDLDPDERVTREAGDPAASAGEQTVFSSFLFTHNIQVAFAAFALGLTAAVGTAVMLFFNGLMLGALAQAYAAKGHAIWFWAWILPHGIPEITAICIAGGAGFVMGGAIVAPGDRRRGDALRAAARTAVTLVLGTLPIFVAAGLIEATISQIHEPRLPSWVKLSFASGMAALLVAYLGVAGRAPDPVAAPAAARPRGPTA